MGDKRLYLIDATAFCYRAFYALKGLSTSFGQPTNAIYGFINMLNKILKEEKPEYLGVCFDISRDTFRSRKFAEYKIQRPPMPEGLSSQIPIIKEIISAYGIGIFEKEGFEADDVIATLAKEAQAQGFSVTIVSSDKDILQLVNNKTVVFSPYKDEGVLYDTDKVKERYGVSPARIADIISLMGDSVDNLPGVPGIGEKTATELIKSYGSLKELLGRIDEVKQEKLRKTLQNNLELIKLNQELAALREDVGIDFDTDKLKIGEPKDKELFKLFKYLEFKKFLQELPAGEDKVQLKCEELKGGELKSLLSGTDELFLCGSGIEDLVFYAKDKFFRLENVGESAKVILEDPKVKKIGHDLKKIKISLAQDGITLGGLYFDTMIAAYLANPSKPDYDLASLGLEFLGEFTDTKNMDNLMACALIVKLKSKLEELLLGRSLVKLFVDLEMPLVEVLSEMELNGIRIDLGVLSSLGKDIEKRLIKLISDIYAMSGSEFNINSPKQLRTILFENLKLPVVKRSKTGPSTDEEVLKKLATQHALPALLLEYRQLAKLKNTYIDALPQLIDEKTGRIHTSFNQAGTETGRLSSSNPNLQNIPIKTDIGRIIRKAVIASAKDKLLVSCDYSQIELRILAHLSKDAGLVEAFRHDEDIHKATAGLIYGLEEKDVADSMREIAKRANFGIVYGLTSYGLARDLGIPIEDAQRFIDAYFLRYPKVKDYINEQIGKAKKDGFVTTLLGRRRYIPQINDKNMGIRQFAERQAVNTPIQGSASDLIKLAMVQIHKNIKSQELNAKMLLQIHDELLFEVPVGELKAGAELIKERMENVLKLDVPIKVDIKKGQNWLEMEEVK